MSNPNQGPDRIDYQETDDITEVHAAVEREKPEPSAEVTPIPMWLTALCAGAVVWAGIYAGIFNGGLSGNVFNEYESSPAVLFPLPDTGKAVVAAAPELTLAQQGKAIFSNCVACHQANGQGVPGQFPPLAKSEWVNGSEKRVIAILLKGIQGQITVEGHQFNGAMPPWESALSPKKIAAVASYIRQEWGNTAPEISEAKVIAAKKEFAAQTAPWTEAQLLQIPADATLPGAAAPASSPAPAAGAPSVPAAAPAAGAPGAAAAVAADPAQVDAGKKVYMGLCIACHQVNGAGLPGAFPPLTNSPYVAGSPERFAAIILKGNTGPFTVDGKPFNVPMPPQESVLDDTKIADVMTFVRSTFGNSAGPVTPAVVAAARAKFASRKDSWTQPELDAWKE
jgi:mono/diheme cytochrome c family protein